MGDDVPTLEQLIASGAVIEHRPDHPLWWRATQADGSVFTFRESAYSHPLHGPEVWHGHKECWCLQDGPHELECEQGLYVDPWEDDRGETGSGKRWSERLQRPQNTATAG